MRKRPRMRGLPAVLDTVDRLNRAFEYPNVGAPAKTIQPLVGVGGVPTIVMAAYNSNSQWNQGADYTCDGVEDDYELQLAIDSLPDAGGRIVFLDGTFRWQNVVQVPTGKSIIFQGMGTTWEFSSTTSFNFSGGPSDLRPFYEFTGLEMTRSGGSNSPLFHLSDYGVVWYAHGCYFRDIDCGAIARSSSIAGTHGAKILVMGNRFYNINLRAAGGGFQGIGVFGLGENPGRQIDGTIIGNRFDTITDNDTAGLSTYIVIGSNDSEGGMVTGNNFLNISDLSAIAGDGWTDAHNNWNRAHILGDHSDLINNQLAPYIINQNTFWQGGDLAQGFGVFKFPFLVDAVLLGFRATVGTAPTGDSIILDVELNGGSDNLFTTQANRPSIAAGAVIGSALAVPNVTAMSAGDWIEVDIDQVGSTTPGSNLTLAMIWRPA